MRREGYEFQVSQPQVIYREVSGQPCEPYECLVLDVPEDGVGIERLGQRRGEMQDMQVGGNGRTHWSLSFPPVVWLFRGEFMRLTRGDGIIPQLPRLPPDQRLKPVAMES